MKNDLYTTGAGLDQRTEEQKAQDWQPKEAFAAATPVVWQEKTISAIEKGIMATSISQGQTSRCVSEYAGIALETAEFVENGEHVVFSRRDIYCRRANRPEEGMSMPDLFKLMKEGACLESQLPSTATRELDINQPYSVTTDMIAARKKYASSASFTWKNYGIDDIAQMIDQKVPVSVFWYFENADHDEWWNGHPTIKLTDLTLFDPRAAHHQCTVVDYTLYNGKKCLVVMDSAGQGTGLGKKKNLRLVSEDFLLKRSYGAGFAIDKKNLDYTVDESIHYNFTRNLQNGAEGDDVMVLQKILVLEGCLQIKTPTRYYGGMTAAGVKKFQEKYAAEILTPLKLKSGTGLFFDATRKFMNKKYA